MTLDDEWVRRLAFTAVCLGSAIAILDASAVNIALPVLARDLGSTISGLQWVTSAYTLVFASCLLTTGVIGDRIGHKRVFISGLIVFGIASPLCSAAPNIGTLVAFRAVQGLGAALMIPASLALVAQMFPQRHDRSRAIGIWAAVNVSTSLLAPLVGGLLVQTLGWRSVFWINVPVVAVAILLAVRTIDETPRRQRAIDLPGQILAIVALSTLTVTFVESGPKGWHSALVLAALSAACVSSVMFVVVEHRLATPMLPLSLFKNRTFSSAALMLAMNTFVIYGTIFLLSLYLQDVRGYSALGAGVAFIPMAGAGVPFTLYGGRIAARRGPRLPMAIGYGLAALGTIVFATVDRTSSYPYLVIGLVLFGIGGSLSTPPTLAAVSTNAPPERDGVVSGVINSSRQVGATLGVAVLGAFVATHFISGLHVAFWITTGILLTAMVLSTVAIQSHPPRIRVGLEMPPVSPANT